MVQRLRVAEHHCETLAYHYRVSLSEDKQDWLICWEYSRHRPVPAYPYPLAHVHVTAALIPSATGAALAKLHIRPPGAA